MSTPPKKYDVLIIGGGTAGLATALAVARTIRTVCLFDGGSYGNSASSHMHNVLTWDHKSPVDFRRAARADIARYETVDFKDVKVTKVWKHDDDNFEVTDEAGNVTTGRRLVLATGTRDIFPNVTGFGDCWSKSIFNCLYCEGYEHRGAANVSVLATENVAAANVIEHHALMARQLGKHVTVYTHGSEEFVEQYKARFGADADWVSIETRKIERLHQTDGQALIVELEGGEKQEQTFMVHVPKPDPTLQFEHNLDLKLSDNGKEYKTDELLAKSVSEKHVWLPGDASSLYRAVGWSMSRGATCAEGVVMSIMH